MTELKTRPEQLAVLGGEPAFAEPLHVGRPNIGDAEALIGRLREVLDSRILTNMGPQVRQLEQALCRRLGVRHCIPLCNGTVALEIAIRALGLTGEVLVPAYTFVATAHALEWLGLTPVFCDVHPETHSLDPARLEERLTPRTSGVIGVHLWGRACDVEGLSTFAARNGLKLLFDAAHAFDCSHGGRMIGNFGDAEVFSFHATKFFNTFEGGAIATNDDDLAQRIRLMQNFGFAGYDQVVELGTNGKMSEVSAAMGLTGLASLEEVVCRNRSHNAVYRQALEGLPGVRFYTFPEQERVNYQYVVLQIDPAAGLSRDDLLDVLWAENVRARRYFYPGCHRMAPYAERSADLSALLPVTERLSEQVLCLPTGTAMTQEDVEAVCGIIRVALENGSRVASALAPREMPEPVVV